MQQRRRRFLRAAAGTLAVGLAGCLNEGGDGSDGDGEDGSDGSDGTDGTDADGGDGTEAGDQIPPSDLEPPVAGDPDADVTVTVFEDLRCPHCADFNDEVYPQLESEYVDPGAIRYVHRDFPVVNQWSELYAYAGRSVQSQAGDEAFFDFAKTIFERQTEQTEALVAEAATAAGADEATTLSDMNDGTYAPAVERDQSAGQDRGVSATPTVFVGDEEVSQTYDAIATAIDDRR